jgi:hypothetical protein
MSAQPQRHTFIGFTLRWRGPQMVRSTNGCQVIGFTPQLSGPQTVSRSSSHRRSRPSAGSPQSRTCLRLPADRQTDHVLLVQCNHEHAFCRQAGSQTDHILLLHRSHEHAFCQLQTDRQKGTPQTSLLQWNKAPKVQLAAPHSQARAAKLHRTPYHHWNRLLCVARPITSPCPIERDKKD